MTIDSLIVVKVGGSEGIDYQAVCDDVGQLLQSGIGMVLVHGGSSQTNIVAEALGHPPQFITSPSGYTSRLTDRRTLEIFEMVYCGQVNKMMVERLQSLGVNAVGLSGMDGGLWRGPRKKVVHAVDASGKKRVIRDNFTGKVEQVNTDLLHMLLSRNYLPVLTPPAISDEAEAINVDGDRAAAVTAIAMKATNLVILSNVPGVLAEFPDESTRIDQIRFADIDRVAEESAAGRMRIKLLAAKEALEGGVRRVVLGDARIPHPIREALAGQGTILSAGDS